MVIDDKYNFKKGSNNGSTSKNKSHGKHRWFAVKYICFIYICFCGRSFKRLANCFNYHCTILNNFWNIQPSSVFWKTKIMKFLVYLEGRSDIIFKPSFVQSYHTTSFMFFEYKNIKIINSLCPNALNKSK